MAVVHLGVKAPTTSTTSFTLPLPADIEDNSWLLLLCSSTGSGTIGVVSGVPSPSFDTGHVTLSTGALARGWLVPVGAAQSNGTATITCSAAGRMAIVGAIVRGETPDVAYGNNLSGETTLSVPSTTSQAVTVSLGTVRIASPPYSAPVVPSPLTNVHHTGTDQASGATAIGWSAEGAGSGGQTITHSGQGRQAALSASFAPVVQTSAFSLWDGTAESPLPSPTLWDGTAEVPIAHV